MTDTAHTTPVLADQVTDVDVIAVVELILSRPRHGAMSASLAAIIAMAERIRDLDAVAFGAADLIAEIAKQRRTTHVVAMTCSIGDIPDIVDSLTGALKALRYVEQDSTTPAQPRGDDT